MRKIRRSKLTGFIIIPLIFVLLTYLLIFTVFSPVLSPLFSAFKLFSTNESYSNTSQSIFLPNGQSGGSVSIKNISFPKYGMHYATIKLPESKGTSDIYFGDSDENLKKGVGQYIGSFLPGYGAPILIGGHNNTYFNGLKNIKKDDIITITTSYGTFKYKVTNTK
ncbi:MAG: hypothetical protein K0R90_1597, partial [Oscillospiraceae bacterium]|nr:hypothetical protein [Oscillospiraceae bacterium]